jgi:REP element-mobilizing transposase RayT
MAMRDRSTHKRVYSAKYHLIWCPTYRRRVLVGGAPLAVVRCYVED